MGILTSEYKDESHGGGVGGGGLGLLFPFPFPGPFFGGTLKRIRGGISSSESCKACTTTYTWLFTLGGACCGGGNVGGEGVDGTGIGSSGLPYCFELNK